MVDNSIDAIRSAELEADQILNDANKEIERIKENTVLEAERLSNDAEAAAKAAADKLITSAREKGRLLIRDAEALQAEELSALHHKSDEKREEAIASVIASLI
jgi:V/A-type H+-transporting ATPase subunit G/H